MKIIQPFGQECPHFFIDEGVRKRIKAGSDSESPEEMLFCLWAECRSVLIEPVLDTRSGKLEELAKEIEVRLAGTADRTVSVRDLPITMKSWVVGDVRIKRKGQNIVVCTPEPEGFHLLN